jgi:DNA-binding MarR family transcriptional regulator
MTVTDSEILESLNGRAGTETYVVRTILAKKHRDLTTAYVLRRLKRLEQAGQVRRVQSSHPVMICWALT